MENGARANKAVFSLDLLYILILIFKRKNNSQSMNL